MEHICTILEHSVVTIFFFKMDKFRVLCRWPLRFLQFSEKNLNFFKTFQKRFPHTQFLAVLMYNWYWWNYCKGGEGRASKKAPKFNTYYLNGPLGSKGEICLRNQIFFLGWAKAWKSLHFPDNIRQCGVFSISCSGWTWRTRTRSSGTTKSTSPHGAPASRTRSGIEPCFTGWRPLQDHAAAPSEARTPSWRPSCGSSLPSIRTLSHWHILTSVRRFYTSIACCSTGTSRRRTGITPTPSSLKLWPPAPMPERRPKFWGGEYLAKS